MSGQIQAALDTLNQVLEQDPTHMGALEKMSVWALQQTPSVNQHFLLHQMFLNHQIHLHRRILLKDLTHFSASAFFFVFNRVSFDTTRCIGRCGYSDQPVNDTITTTSI